ncbi:hypothetical protein [Mycobacterium sp. 050134]|uniref:hypothetical protein n=1 Tax=Mycobacterium sp. 050134 TaxID=3096111 RepID=UPI002ED860AB
MTAAPQPADRTRVFARVIGPYLIIVTATALAHAAQMRSLLSEFAANPVWPWLTGAFVLPMGLMVVVLHRHWRGAAAIVVSVLGWLTALKGLLLMAIPQTYVSVANSGIGAGGWWQGGMVAVGALGVYLTCVGWVPAPAGAKSRAPRATRHLHRAA